MPKSFCCKHRKYPLPYAWWVVPNQLIDLVYPSQFSQSVRRRMRTLACARAVSPNIDPLPINTNTSQSHRRLFCLISTIHCKCKPVPISELANQSQSIAKLGKNEALASLLECFFKSRKNFNEMAFEAHGVEGLKKF